MGVSGSPDLFPSGRLTVKVALAAPLLPSDEVRSPLVLTLSPTLALVTSTWTVQLVPAATVPLV